MASVPAFLLKKLYVKGSLKNTPEGFQLTIQNTLAPATIVGLVPLQVDGVDHALEKTKITLPDGTQVSPSEVSADSPRRFGINDKVTIHVQAPSLTPGMHKLTISTKTKEAGLIQISTEDIVA